VKADFYLQIGAVLAALTSAAFWFLSARAKSPPMTWAGVGNLPKFLQRMSRYNLIASLFAFASAILIGIAIAVH